MLSLCLVTGELLLTFGDDMFPRLFMLLGVLICCFCIWSIRYLLTSLLAVFEWEIFFIRFAYYLRFLQPVSSTPAPYFLLFLVADFLSLEACIPLIPFDMLICLSSSPPSPSHGGPTSIPQVLWDRNGFL